MNLKLLIIGLFALVAGFGPWQDTASARVGKWTFEKTVARSELIVIGEVVAIAFRDSVGGEGYLQAPHTFVTYRIDKTLRGSFAGPTLTLRLTGGYSPSTGRVMIAPHAPMFRLGDRDLLFVRGNGTALCPLVACGLGRFRVVEDEIYSDKGLAVRLDPDGRLTYGPDALPDAAISMEVPPAPASRLEELRRRLAEDSGLGEQESERLKVMLEVLSRPQRIGLARVGERPEAPVTPAVRIDAFVAFIRQLSDKHPVPDKAVKSVSPDARFRVKAPAAMRSALVSRPANEREQTLEQRLLERNGGNPVLGDIQ